MLWGNADYVLGDGGLMWKDLMREWRTFTPLNSMDENIVFHVKNHSRRHQTPSIREGGFCLCRRKLKPCKSTLITVEPAHHRRFLKMDQESAGKDYFLQARNWGWNHFLISCVLGNPFILGRFNLLVLTGQRSRIPRNYHRWWHRWPAGSKGYWGWCSHLKRLSGRWTDEKSTKHRAGRVILYVFIVPRTRTDRDKGIGAGSSGVVAGDETWIFVFDFCIQEELSFNFKTLMSHAHFSTSRMKGSHRIDTLLLQKKPSLLRS